MRRKIKTIKKWKISNKAISDFKIKENQRVVESHEVLIKELALRLTTKCDQIKVQRQMIQEIVQLDKNENIIPNISDYINESNYGLIREENLEEDLSNVAAA